jgi:Carboxypeptidase regulatory-like domain
MDRIVKSSIVIAITWVAFGFASSSAFAQNLSNGSIVGKVTDASGAAVPNVLVTVTSPQLQVPQVTTTSDAQGDYSALNLPAPGVYHVKFTLQGFETFERSDLNLTVGFAARVDATMQVGAVTQTVSVTGSSPVVDTVNSAVESTISREQVFDTPKSPGMQELQPMAEGLSMTGPPDVGDSQMVDRASIITFGIQLTPTLSLEGINNADDHSQTEINYLDAFNVESAEYKTDGNNADVAYSGVDGVVVMKSGSNTFHGDYRYDAQPPQFQGNNISGALAAPPNNLKVTNPLHSFGYYDYSFDIGGRILRDKLWGYGGIYKQGLDEGFVNFYGAPDSTINTSSYGLTYACWTCGDAKPAFIYTSLPGWALKFNYQATQSVQFIFSNFYGNKHEFAEDNSATEPLPTDGYELQPGASFKGEMQVTKPRWILDAIVGCECVWTTYTPEPASILSPYGWTNGTNFAGDPSEMELSNGLLTGIWIDSQDFQYTKNLETNVNFSYIPKEPHLGGTHQLKAGTTDDWDNEDIAYPRENKTGDYYAIFSNGVPFEVEAFNFPLYPSNVELGQGIYGTDTWKIRRVTLNLGVRWDHWRDFYGTETTTAIQFQDIFPHVKNPGATVANWNDVVPRLGAVWDVRGNGKTVIKGSFGMFGDHAGDTLPAQYNNDNLHGITYSWPGATNPNLCQGTAALAPVEYKCDVTSAFLATLPTLTPISSSGGSSQVLNPNLTEPKIQEYVARFERQVAPNVSVAAGYVGHIIHNLYNSETNGGSVSPTTSYAGSGQNVGHPYNTYTLPATFTDALTGAPVTLYTYLSPNTAAGAATCASTGCTSNEILNTPSSRPDYYNVLEFSATKRYSNKWNLGGSYWLFKDHRWINGLAGLNGSPNDANFPLDTTWNWEMRINGVYNLPMGFKITSFFRNKSGAWGQRTETFSGKGLNGQALNQGSVTINMGPFGQYQGPHVEVWNVQGAKVFTIHERYKIEANAQVFNLLNGSGAVSTNYKTTTNPASPTFGVITSIESARVARLGVEFSF